MVSKPLHQQFRGSQGCLGPIVRITPNEVHIKDRSFWDELFVRRPNGNKTAEFNTRFGNDDSMFAVAEAGRAKRLRAPLNPL